MILTPAQKSGKRRLPRQKARDQKIMGYHSGKMSRNYSEHDEHKIKPHLLRTLPKHRAVIAHCERGHRRKLLPPVDPDGEVSRWFRAA